MAWALTPGVGGLSLRILPDSLLAKDGQQAGRYQIPEFHIALFCRQRGSVARFIVDKVAGYARGGDELGGTGFGLP